MDFFSLLDVSDVDEILWESIRYCRPQESIILIRVYEGGERGNQNVPFCAAKHEMYSTLSTLAPPRSVVFESLTIKQLFDRNLGTNDLIKWLLESHIHIILTHIHQGFSTHGSGINVDMNEMMRNLLRLRYHVGFPSGEHLYCPVFTQDKRRYLQALGSYANNSLFIPLQRVTFKVILDEYKDEIAR